MIFSGEEYQNIHISDFKAEDLLYYNYLGNVKVTGKGITTDTSVAFNNLVEDITIHSDCKNIKVVKWNAHTITVKGNYATGIVDGKGKLIVEKDLIINWGTLQIIDGCVEVEGDVYVNKQIDNESTGGVISMDNEDAYFLIHGDLYSYGARHLGYFGPYPSRYIKGTLELKGDLYGDYHSSYAWYVTDEFNMIFSGEEYQNVHITTYKVEDSQYYNYLGNVKVSGKGITTDTGIAIRSLVEDITIHSDCEKVEVAKWNSHTITVEGNCNSGSINNGTLIVKGNFGKGKVDEKGQLFVEKDIRMDDGALEISNGRVEVEGDVYLNKGRDNSYTSAFISMDNEDAYLLIKGDLYSYGYRRFDFFGPYISEYKKGTLELKGNLYGDYYSSYAWYVTDEFNMIFSGEEYQNVDITTYKAEGSKCYNYLGNVRVTGKGLTTDTGFAVLGLDSDLLVSGNPVKVSIGNWNNHSVKNSNISKVVPITTPDGYGRKIERSSENPDLFDVTYMPAEETYTVSYYVGSKLVNTQEGLVKDSLVEPYVYKLSNGNKVTWCLDEIGFKKFKTNRTPLTGDLVLYGVENILPAKKLDVVFDANGGLIEGEDLLKVKTEEDEEVTRPSDPVRKGYTFAGWYHGDYLYDFGAYLQEDLTLTAKWTPATYTVKLVTPNGKLTNGDSMLVTYDQPYGELPEPEYGYGVFLGWFTAEEGGDEVTSHTVVTEAEDHTLYAHFDMTKYDIYLDANGHGESPEKVSQIYVIPANLPTVSETGYTFGGWYTTKECEDGNRAVPETKLTEDITLFAKWTPNEYTVKFDAGLGKVSSGTDSLTVTFGQAYGELPVAEAEDKIFAGWFTSLENGSEVTAETTVNTAGNHTLYAVYIDDEALLAPYVVDSYGNRYESGAELDVNSRLYLTSDNHKAAIYYTTDANEAKNIPEDEEHLYKESIALLQNMTVYVKAVKDGYRTSKVAAYSFTVTDPTDYWGTVQEADRDGFDSADEVPKGLWAAGYEDTDYTGNAITFADLRVYYGKILLKAGEDYTVKYANNIKASNAKTKATIAITGKGNFAGTKKINFKVNPLSLGDENGNSEFVNTVDVQAEETGKVIKSTTTVSYKLNGKELMLKKGTDFTYDYSEVAKEAGTYTVKIIGKGNFAGVATFTETVYPKKTKTNIAKLTFATIKAQSANGSPLEPAIVITDKVTDKKNPHILVEDDEAEDEFDVEYFNNILPGTATAVVTGKGEKYAGTKTLTFKINGIALSKAKYVTDSKAVFTYDGTKQAPDYKLTYQAGKNADIETLKEDVDYTVVVTNNINKGTGTITFTGKGRFSGSLKKTFKIGALNLNSGKITVTCKDKSSSLVAADLGSFVYTKGGVKPETVLTFNGEELVLNRDYKVKYANNNAVGGTGKKTPTLTITGAGNYTGTMTRTFSIEKASLADTTVTATDIQYSAKAGICKPSIVVYDTNGAKLVAGKDYDNKKIEYTYVSDTTVKRKQGRALVYHDVTAGTLVDLKKDIIPAGTDIRVTLYGKGLYSDATSSSAEFTFVNSLISKATVTFAKGKNVFEYTGNGIEISEADLTVKIGRTNVPMGAYRITSITENTKKGTAKVTIEGVGKYGSDYYGGTKTVTFKINARKIK